jgi:glyoxylase-like metal-dependent hydrolase (beta-lactamase superfamily II)
MGGAGATCQQVGERIWLVRNHLQRSNSFVCATGEPGACFLVDPGTDGEAIDAALGGLGLTPRQVFCTHGHFDHTASAALFQERYGAACYLHGADQKTLRGSNFLMMAFKIPLVMKLPRTEELAGFAAAVGALRLEAIAAPGHTPGSCVLRYGDALFTGDTLYARGVGLSKLPGGDDARLKATLLALWDAFPAGTQVLPGHGPCGTLAAIKAENQPLRSFLGLDALPGGAA